MKDISQQLRTITEQAMLHALETYANVHRGSGPNAAITTALLEEARRLVLNFSGFSPRKYSVVFCSPMFELFLDASGKKAIAARIGSKETGIKLGVVALVFPKTAIKKMKQVFAGGGTTQLYGNEWVMWAKGNERLEAGTPAIINCIGFARALQLLQTNQAQQIASQSQWEFNPLLEAVKVGGEPVLAEKLLQHLRQSRIGAHTRVPSKRGAIPYIHFDNASSTPALEPVWDAFRQSWYLAEDQQQHLVDQSRALIHQFFDAPADGYDILFTSNTTEAINLLARGLFRASDEKAPFAVVSSIMEHSSNDLPWRETGAELLRLEVSENGLFDLIQLEKWLKAYNLDMLHGDSRIALVSLTAASNVTGSCNNMAEISTLVHRYGALFMVDAAQLAAHKAIQIAASGIDFLVLSGHKMYAPFGAGFLITKKNQLHFDQPAIGQIMQAGEENAGGIVALAKAIQLMHAIGFDVIEKEEEQLYSFLLEELQKVKELKLYGFGNVQSRDKRQHLGSIVFGIGERMPGRIAGKLAAERGIGSRFGCHCAHLYVKRLFHFSVAQEKIQRFVLKMIPALRLQGMLRISVGMLNTKEDALTLLETLHAISDPKGRAINHAAIKSSYKRNLKQFIHQRKQLVFGGSE